MKKAYIILSIFSILLFGGCGKDFLKVIPKESATGDNYWKSEGDVEKFIVGIYKSLRSTTMGSSKNARIFFPATGDLRCAPINRTSQSYSSKSDYLSFLKANDINLIIKGSYPGFQSIPNWEEFFRIVQLSNITYYQVDNMAEDVISSVKADQYKAEAVFLRNLAYFFMVRLYGDVPYYTEAYHSKAIGRTEMLVVLKNISADMEAHYKNLPWTYELQSKRGNRAMRGAAITLMMHVNMWIAGFTNEDKNTYYNKVILLGEEIMNQNNQAYELLSLDDTKEIFKGGTKEGLFEIVQDLNYGESFSSISLYADNFLRYPNKNKAALYSNLYYDLKFTEQLYPRSVTDKRKSIWYDKEIYDINGKMQFLKFLNLFNEGDADFISDDNQMVFRYVDPILLRAEALAELGRDPEAREIVNIIRKRAEATLADNQTGDDLKDFIWWERVRELMGEGHFYYDLVRTKKIINSKYTSAALSVDAYNRRGWTWPIDINALRDNPYMTLNNYWNQ